jgi:hypothetical protein
MPFYTLLHNLLNALVGIANKIGLKKMVPYRDQISKQNCVQSVFRNMKIMKLWAQIRNVIFLEADLTSSNEFLCGVSSPKQ